MLRIPLGLLLVNVKAFGVFGTGLFREKWNISSSNFSSRHSSCIDFLRSACFCSERKLASTLGPFWSIWSKEFSIRLLSQSSFLCEVIASLLRWSYLCERWCFEVQSCDFSPIFNPTGHPQEVDGNGEQAKEFRRRGREVEKRAARGPGSFPGTSP